MLLSLVESRKKDTDSLFICILSSGKTTFVYTIVDIIVGPLISFVNLISQAFRIQVNFLVFVVQKIIELWAIVLVNDESLFFFFA